MFRATPESPRMFESDFVDAFSRVVWWVVPLIWLPVAAALMLKGLSLGVPVAAAAGCWVLGWFAWTLAEYSLHRWPFHWRFGGGKLGDRLHFLMHGVHHEWVHDRLRLVMPPAVSAGLFALFWGFWLLVAGEVWMFPIYSGFVFGYVVYDCVHYATHHGRFDNRVFKRLKAHHMNHHFNHPEKKFGVSTTFWDHVFRTW